jgi:putative heme-binding domain-containing protein
VKLLTCILPLVLLTGIALADEPAKLSPKDKLTVETILRLKDFDIESSAPAKAAMLRYLRAQAGTDQYFNLIERFKLAEIADELASYSLQHADETSGVRGAELLFAMDRGSILQAALDGSDELQAIAAAKLIGHAAGKQTIPMLFPVVTSPEKTVALRSLAVAAVGRFADGQQKLLELVTTDALAADLKFAAANVLLSSTDEAIKAEAAKYLQLPATADSQPLPPLAELVARKGDVKAGEIVFRETGTCIKCHKVRGEGKEVGPDLTEIGSKLSREAMYVSILDPSAAVSHNFETYALVTDEGVAVSGLLISDTDEAVTLRTSEGIDKTVDKESLEVFQKQKQSLMPQDLQKLMTVDQLVNLVEYAMTLRKADAP